MMAATAYARAWNRLDCTEFLDLLAPEARYASQWVFEDMEGKAAIASYLVAKMETVRGSDTPVFAELAKTSAGLPCRDCVALAQGQKDVVKAAVLFEVVADHIDRFDLCMPELLRPIGSGHYPS